MKKTTIPLAIMLIATSVSVLTSASATSESGIPSVNQSASTAGGSPSGGQKAFQNLTASTASDPSGFLTVVPVLGPTMTSSSFSPFAANVLADAMANNFHDGLGNSPTNYALCHGVIRATNLVYSQTTPLWGAILNPPAPFDSEKGQVVSLVVAARSFDGKDSISLTMISETTKSSDSGNVLGGGLTLDSSAYSALAVGKKADGTLVTDGDGAQLVKELYFIIKPTLFNGGATQDGLNQVFTWVGQQVSFSISYTLQFVGQPETAVTAKVSIAGYSNVRPTLTISGNSLSLTKGESGRVYTILSSPNVNGPWSLFGWQNAGGQIPITASGNQFFKAMAQ